MVQAAMVWLGGLVAYEAVRALPAPVLVRPGATRSVGRGFMKVAIVEPSFEAGGHHCVHVRHIILECLRRGWSVCLCTCLGRDIHPAIAELPAHAQGAVVVRYMPFVAFPRNPTPVRLLQYQFAWCRVFRDFIEPS